MAGVAQEPRSLLGTARHRIEPLQQLYGRNCGEEPGFRIISPGIEDLVTVPASSSGQPGARLGFAEAADASCPLGAHGKVILDIRT